MSTPVFHGRLGVQQRVLPDYRVPFFELLAQACQGGMSLFSGSPRPSEGIKPASQLRTAKYVLGANTHLFNGPLYLCYQRGLLEWMADWDPSALILEANPRYLSSTAAFSWMRERGRRVIGWGLGSPPISGPLAGIRRSRRLHFLRQFDALIAYSQRGADEYAALGFPRAKIFVAHNAVSLPPSTLPPRLPSKMGRITLLFVGRLQARKRVDLLLRACAQTGSKARLVIVGDGPERAKLQSLARQVYPAAEFAGAKHGAELESFFAEADLFVLPGTGGLAVQQAMGHGLPVIVAKGDGTQDDLVRNENGWQIAPDDLGALVSAMNAALAEPARLRKMGQESHRIVSEEINIRRMVEVFVRALNA